ncbi:Panacea domain-containing protein [Treponema sp.]|uniref:Panacea domain-containing protein n=1 Tax=Treponema sp. TaxID=166 RepID=UPI00298EC56B|nr:type II toxin-antitoxin system antitoxin SocA domain-containing protein [Treponema sp.]MCQ2242421.1 DUF4065 domain-containing protein [Treponema sp.]
MAYSALDVAKYVINYELSQGRSVTNLRLQKLLYFVQAKVLVETGKPCFEDEMEAWDYGPVSPSVYHNYKFFGAWSLAAEPGIHRIPNANIVNNMLSYCSNYSTNLLVDITHKQRPWIEAYAKGRGTTIHNKDIEAFFKYG